MSHGQQNKPGSTHPAEVDAFLTIAERRETEIKILASRFLSYAVPVRTVEAFLEILETVRKEHYDATHHCFACRTGYDDTSFRFSDDGEPSGTAGKRILGALDRHHLTDTGIIIVRYFGGTKLGVGGLARAYTDAAESVLGLCTIETRYLTDEFTITFPYEVTSQVHHAIEGQEAEIISRNWQDNAEYALRVRCSRRERLLQDLAELTQRQVVLVRNTETPDAK
ncbi:MAG: IMPACT family protein [Bacteroidia bacterium]|nr:IMPACT family protein [Bacteroidia bacterium]